MDSSVEPEPVTEIELSPKDSWPKTEFGTVDWEVVFEAPETGFLALIEQAQSAKALLECSIIIIKQIYTRKDDPAKVEQFVEELTELISDDLPPENLGDITAVVSTLLRQVKDFRIQKAQEHVDLLAAEEEAKQIVAAATNANEAKSKRQEDPKTKAAERRSEKNFSEYRKKQAAAKKSNSIRMYSIILGLIAAAGVIMYIFAGDGRPKSDAALGSLLMQQIIEAAKTKKGGKHVYGGDIRVHAIANKTEITVNSVPRVHCFKFVRSLSRNGDVYINGTLTRRLKISQIKDRCNDSGSASDVRYIPK